MSTPTSAPSSSSPDGTPLRFADLVDATYELTELEQQTLLEVLKKELLEKSRASLVQEVHKSQREHDEGKGRTIEDPAAYVKGLLDEAHG